MANRYGARVLVNDNATDGEFTKAKLLEYYKLGASIMVDISGTSFETQESDLPLDLNIEADAKKFFRRAIA